METVSEKSSFKELLNTNRCIIPSNGFYEWESSDFAQPYFVSLADKELFSYAGYWRNVGSSTIPQMQFVIMTLPANGKIAEIHDRMPAILPNNLVNDWLNLYFSFNHLKSELAVFKETLLKIYPVSTKINKIKFDTPDLLLPGDEQLRLF